ncbi:hypothetical protein FRB99_005030 [Tulasnella sp. 403]|nr:hypothetical protein FRB99_005030 [Tulasnella sp. 403]
MHSQVQVVCIPSTDATHGPSLHVLLNPVPATRRNRNRLRRSSHSPLSSPTPPAFPARRSSACSHASSRVPCTPFSSFLNLIDTPSATRKTRSKSLSLAPPSAGPLAFSPSNRICQVFTFDPNFSFSTPAPPTNSNHDQTKFEEPRASNDTTLVSEGHRLADELDEKDSSFAFLHSDPYAGTSPSSDSAPKYTSNGRSLAPLQVPSKSFFDVSPLPSPTSAVGPRKRSSTTSESATSKRPPTSTSVVDKVKRLKRTFSFTNPLKQMSSSRPSSSGSASARRSHKPSEKVLPLSTGQISELDRMFGNTKAAKGKVPSSFAPGTHAPEPEKRYIAPYVPLNGSAPSGTRSFGRDGEMHPIGASLGTGAREVGHGNALPYFRDETVMIPEGGGFAPVSTLGGLAKAGIVSVPVSTRGVESFPSVPYPDPSSPGTHRHRGAERRRPVTALSSSKGANYMASVTSLGTVRPGLPLDKEGKMEYFADSFAPPPAKQSFLPKAQPLHVHTGGNVPPAPPSKSRLHRHSTSVALGSTSFFANIVGSNNTDSPPLTPVSPPYLAPMSGPNPYNGVRQSSFSGVLPGWAKRPSTSGSLAEKSVKKKGSGLNVAGMFKKLAAK